MEKELEILVSNKRINKAIKKYAKEVEKILAKEKNVVFIAILNGVFIFLTEIFNNINSKYSFNFELISVSSYKKNISSELKINKWIETDLTNKHVIIIEDIIDTGNTLTKVIDKLEKENKIKKLDIVSLLDKTSCHPNFSKKYRGLIKIEDKFIVGFGMDYGEKYRNLKDIRIYKK